MVHNLFDQQLGELHRQDLIAAAASAHLRRSVDRDRPHVRLAAVAAWLSRHLGGHLRVRRARPAPSRVETSLNIH
jgi:hypothetical protein